MTKFDTAYDKAIKTAKENEKRGIEGHVFGDAYIARLSRDWTQYAGEPVKVEKIRGTYYGFGSELACLRIFKKYATGGSSAVAKGDARCNYSSNMKQWYFSLDV